MVAGGLDVTSRTTRLTSATEFVIRVGSRHYPRTTTQIKADAAAVYARRGISLSDAINIFLAKSIEVGSLPFDMRTETPTFDGRERYSYRPARMRMASHSSRETGMTANRTSTQGTLP